MKNQNFLVERGLTKEEVSIFTELCKKNEEPDVEMFLDIMEITREDYLKMLINIRYRYENNIECTDFEKNLHDATSFAAKAYATEIYTNYYANNGQLPFNEVEPTNDDSNDLGK